jgi:hypothetical protein
MTTSLRHKSRAPLCVSIVSANPETLDGLHAYLARAGVPCRCTRAIGSLAAVAPGDATAAVLFPDDFEAPAMRALVRQLRHARPRLFTVVVTCDPQRFGDLGKSDGRTPALVVLPKPSFGWDILDAIRAFADADQD